MARTEARVRTSIWNDPDFRALTPNAQLTYVFLLSQSDLSYAGVLPLRVRRWAGHAAGVDAKTLADALRELEAKRFIVADRETEELLVRTFMRNDEVYRQLNLVKAARKSLRDVASPRLRAEIGIEAARCLEEAGDETKAERLIRQELCAMARDIDDGTPREGHARGTRGATGTPQGTPREGSRGRGVTTVTTDNPLLLSPDPLPLDPSPRQGSSTPARPARSRGKPKPVDADDPDFARFWGIYPRRQDKGAARAAWPVALTKAPVERIVAGAARYRDDPNREPEFTKQPATWLNAEGWDDDPLPAKTPKGYAERNGRVVKAETAVHLDLLARMRAEDAEAQRRADVPAIEGGPA